MKVVKLFLSLHAMIASFESYNIQNYPNIAMLLINVESPGRETVDWF